MGDNEMTLGAVYRSPGIFLTAEENPRKPQLGDRLMKGLCDQPSPQMGFKYWENAPFVLEHGHDFQNMILTRSDVDRL